VKGVRRRQGIEKLIDLALKLRCPDNTSRSLSKPIDGSRASKPKLGGGCLEHDRPRPASGFQCLHFVATNLGDVSTH
jgi:hypothetical protein